MTKCNRLSRVTVDLDGYIPQFHLTAIRSYHTLKHIADEVEVRVSSSGTGIHLIGWFDEYVDDERKEKLRRHLSDDANRVRLDSERAEYGHTTNVLWEPDSEWDDIYGALEHITTQTPMQERFKESVQRGLVV